MTQEELDEKQNKLTPASNWFQNRGLFSDHYLKERLPEQEEWKVDSRLAIFRDELLALYQAKKSILSYLNEAQTEDEFIKPVLDLLGYTDSYIVQAATKLGQQTNRPDYALFPDTETKNEAYIKIESNDYTQCIGIADAKYWERELDLAKTNDRDTFKNLNPSFQVAGYLTGTKQNWGILTNGRLWRLYSTKSHLSLGNYYQVDIVQLLEEAPAEALKYFYIFLRKEALLRIDGQSFLDRVLEGSEEYAVELETDIKERAYDVVELLCRGFAADFADGKVNDANLKDIYDNSLTLLYRLLFVFYAEARELLPLTANASYRDNYSLRRLVHDIDEVFKKGYELSPASTQYYHQLKTLFNLINNGDLKLGIPEYNGGLFDPPEHPFLETHTIPDSHLIKAIHQLARITDKKLKREVAVDYNTLSERHLGSIYEGLLEFRPRIAQHDVVVALGISAVLTFVVIQEIRSAHLLQMGLFLSVGLMIKLAHSEAITSLAHFSRRMIPYLAIAFLTIVISGVLIFGVFRTQQATQWYRVVDTPVLTALNWLRDHGTSEDHVVAGETPHGGIIGWWVEGYAKLPTYFAVEKRWLSFRKEREQADVAHRFLASEAEPAELRQLAERHRIRFLLFHKETLLNPLPDLAQAGFINSFENETMIIFSYGEIKSTP